MPRLKKGIEGGFSGKIGNIVGSSWRGMDIIRAAPKKPQKPPTAKQLLQREKFRTAVNFVNAAKEVVYQFFGKDEGTRTRYNNCVSYLVNRAVEVMDNEPKFNYHRILVTKGELMQIQNPATDTIAEQLQVSWIDNSQHGNASSTDLFWLLFYDDVLNQSFSVETAFTRSAGFAKVAIPK